MHTVPMSFQAPARPSEPPILDEDGMDWLRAQAGELGFSQIGVSGIDLRSAEAGLLAWLAAGFHGEMAYMARHGLRRARPAELVPGTVSVITARMPYLPEGTEAREEKARPRQTLQGTVSVYARGRDYHKVLRRQLQRLADALAERVGPLGARVFTDSAPVLEVELAQRSGLGWRGQHTLLLHRQAGSFFFLGEIYIDRPLPPTEPVSAHCGRCTACLDDCPTGALVAPGRLDARRCIAYLTIEWGGAIPEDLRPWIGNRIYGCDDCQWACPWNRDITTTLHPDFATRPGLQGPDLLTHWAWDPDTFARHTQGTPIFRIGWAQWQRNVAVALGNALRGPLPPEDAARIRLALQARRDSASPLLQEHIDWALKAP